MLAYWWIEQGKFNPLSCTRWRRIFDPLRLEWEPICGYGVYACLGGKPKVAHAEPTWFAGFKISFSYGIGWGINFVDILKVLGKMMFKIIGLKYMKFLTIFFDRLIGFSVYRHVKRLITLIVDSFLNKGCGNFISYSFVAASTLHHKIYDGVLNNESYILHAE